MKVVIDSVHEFAMHFVAMNNAHPRSLQPATLLLFI